MTLWMFREGISSKSLGNLSYFQLFSGSCPPLGGAVGSTKKTERGKGSDRGSPGLEGRDPPRRDALTLNFHPFSVLS